MIVRPLLLLAACALLAHCTSKEQPLKPVEGSEATQEGPTYLVGIVEFVNPEQNFVLIKAQGGITMPAGHTLTALDATGALSELVISPERKATHLSADIKSGTPRAGNLVVYRPKNQASPGTPAPAAATSTTTPPLVPLTNMPPSSDPKVEWREGQPPPLFPSTPAPTQPSPIPAQPITPIPLEPLPEEPSKPS